MVEFSDPNATFPDLRACNDMTPKEAALYYARAGIFVILLTELAKNPHPFVAEGWTGKSTRDLAIIASWYDRYPNANVGISATPEFIFLDLDTKDADANGLTSFAGLHEHVLGPTALTPSGGVHRIFRRPLNDDRVNRNLSPRKAGFDFMQDRRRQIVVAPSVVAIGNGETRKYRWTQGGEPARMPKAAIDKMYELSGRVKDRENDPTNAPETPVLGEIIPHKFEIDVSDRSHGAFALARDLYQHHGSRSDSDILATVWDVSAFRDAAMDRRHTMDSAVEWIWRYCVWPAEKSKFVDPGWDNYDPRSTTSKALADGRPLAPWEVPNDAAAIAPAFRNIRTLSELVSDYQEPPEFVVPHYFPKGVLTTLYGKDGTGKTLFLQRVCTLLAAGKPVLGRPAGPKVKCLMVLTEDTMPAIIDRQKRIRTDTGVDYHEVRDTLVIPENLMLLDVKLVTFDRDLTAATTPFYDALRSYIEDNSPELVVLDPISDIYADEENRREKVSQFMRGLNSLAMEFKIAVVLLGHPAKAEGSEYSGSGAWSSKSRSRLFMVPVSDAPGANVRLLQAKSSYGTRAQDRLLVWSPHGTLNDMGADDQSDFEEDMRNDLIELILHFVRTGSRNAETFTDTPQSGDRYLPKAMVLREMNSIYDIDQIRSHLAMCFQSGLLVPTVVFDGQDGRPLIRDGSRRPRVGVYFPSIKADLPPREEQTEWKPQPPTKPDW